MSLNDIWRSLKGVLQNIESINKAWENLNANENYMPTLISKYKFEHELRDAQKTLTKTAIRLTFEKHGVNNVTVPESEIEALTKEDFNQTIIEAYIIQHYVKIADDKAYSEILKKAKRLTPYLGYEKKTTVNDLVKKNKLKLRLFWSYEFISFNSIEELRALEKLIDITINETKPSETQLNPNANMVQTIALFRGSWNEPKKEARSYVYDTPILEDFRIYKNGKIEIRFKKAVDALKVAKVLCE